MSHAESAIVVSSLKVVMRLPILFSTLCLAAGVAVTATPLLQDPQILIDTGGDSVGISVPPGINQVQPCGSATCTYDFFNDTGSIITSFHFETTINPNLSDAVIAANFSCVDAGGYFLHCSTQYMPSGDLQYLFTGVNPPEGDEDGSRTERGEHEGIPLLGHFVITLTGWTENEELFVGGAPPTLDNSFSTAATPEPAAALTLGTGLLLLGAMWRRRRTTR